MRLVPVGELGVAACAAALRDRAREHRELVAQLDASRLVAQRSALEERGVWVGDPDRALFLNGPDPWPAWTLGVEGAVPEERGVFLVVSPDLLPALLELRDGQAGELLLLPEELGDLGGLWRAAEQLGERAPP